MTDKPFAERMYEAGFDSLIPVIPPAAPLAPSSKIAPSSLGKSPGRRLENGLWVGMNWRVLTATLGDVRTWQRWGANVGLRADRFPALDIDVSDDNLALMIEGAAVGQLGPAVVRIGSPPKRLLPYRTSEPFARMRLLLKRDEKSYLVEWLGAGQQWLVAGNHPTGRAYSWSQDPAEIGAAGLTEVTREKASAFLDYLSEMLSVLGYECTRLGDGRAPQAHPTDQRGLEAPSIDELRAAVSMIPNPDTNRWGEFIRMLYAVKAAAGADDESGFEIFAEWAARWEDTASGEDPRSLWRRTSGPFSLGWSWLAELARPYGYHDADFPTEGFAPSPTAAESVPRPPHLSDQWLAAEVVQSCAAVLRYVSASDQWLVWNTGRWVPDAEMLAEDTVKLELRRIADRIIRQGATKAEKKQALGAAVRICSSDKVAAVARLVKMDRAIAVAPESLDFDPWILNTPGGIVDLKTGKMRPADPDALCTRSTSVIPDFGQPAPRWEQFLREATGGDVELQKYLKRLAGYALTGSTREHQYCFIHGNGGNGKGVFLGVLMGVFGTYHRDSPMETFVASNSDRHPTELAMLAGARLVTASETAAGKAWDEPKLKRMTGGDPITARHMREDFFTYLPQFKLVFIGNHKPEIRNLDRAMRRRTHLVPFIVEPKQVDMELGAKLREEWPAILAWMIEGCQEWQATGLTPPEIVVEATNDYFSESDSVGQWIDECAEPSDEWVTLLELFDSWKEWANRRGEYVGRLQRLAGSLEAKKYARRKHPKKRSIEFHGIKLVQRTDPLEGVAN